MREEGEERCWTSVLSLELPVTAWWEKAHGMYGFLFNLNMAANRNIAGGRYSDVGKMSGVFLG